MVGTTKESGRALFLFLLGFTLLGTSAAGGGIISFLAGTAILIISGFIFKSARVKEGV